MNKNCFRLIFNQARGLLMAVAETAASQGKASGETTLHPLALATIGLFAMLAAPLTQSQIIAAPNAPGTRRPTVFMAPNGVPLVNIQTSSPDGVSRNDFYQFDVQSQGVILNNSRINVQTQLGGWIQGNPWLANGSARVILNEVHSSNPSLLRGFVEVAGQRAQVVIANPAGVTCDGCGFINASRATLTTGDPLISDGNLQGYRVRGGIVTITGNGMDASTTDYTDILARAVQINAGLWANQLKVVAGANQISVEPVTGEPTVSGVTGGAAPGAGPAPAFAIDTAQLGGMYAGKITLLATEAGIGVRNAGAMYAGVGDVVITADGRLENAGHLASRAAIQIQTASGIHNNGAIAAQGDITLTAGQSLQNRGQISAGGDQHLTAPDLDLAGSALHAHNLTLSAANIDNTKGYIDAVTDLTLDLTGDFTNQGQLSAGSTLRLTAPNITNSAQGQISAETTWLSAANTLTNRGLIDGNETRLSATTIHNLGTGRIYGDHVAIAATTLTNDAETITDASGQPTTSAAVIAARQRLDLGIQTLTNRAGALIYSGADGAIGGALDAQGHATGLAQSILNASATIQTAGTLTIAAQTTLNRNDQLSTRVVIDPSVNADRVEPTGSNGTSYPIGQCSGVGGGQDSVSCIVHPEVFGQRQALLPVRSQSGGFCTSPDNCEPVTTTVNYAWNAPEFARFNVPGVQTPPPPEPQGPGGCTQADGSADTGGACTAWRAATDAWTSAYQQALDALAVPLNAYNAAVNEDNRVDRFEDYTLYRLTAQPSHTEVASSAPARIITGGDLNISGNPLALEASSLTNQDSHIIAGGAINLTQMTPNNKATKGESRTTYNGTAEVTEVVTSGAFGTSHKRTWSDPTPYTPAPTITTTDLPTTLYQAHSVTPTTGPGIGARDTTSTEVQGTNLTDKIRSTNPNLTLPASALYNTHPEPTAHALIETDPRFANYRTWLTSDYLLNQLGIDPATTQKRLGDGFYEQQLLREQVAQLTGRRFLGGYANDEAQYQALLDAGATYAKAHQLTPGIELSAAQMAQLTSDIVWLVTQTVTLPDGTTQNVLVPRLYVRVKDGDLSGTGTLLSGDSIHIDSPADLTNSGTIAGRTLVTINAENITNLQGRISGGNVALSARTDLNNMGGRIDAVKSLSAQAGHDLNVTTTTRTTESAQSASGSTFSQTNTDRVAGLYVSGPGGTLTASAGNNLTLTGAQMQNGSSTGQNSTGTGQDSASAGKTTLSAGNNLDLKTITTGTENNVTWNDKNHNHQSQSQESGTRIETNGDITLQAGQDIQARAAQITSQSGQLSATAGRDLTVTNGMATSSFDEAQQHTRSGLFSSKTTTSRDTLTQSQTTGSSLSASSIQLQAGHDATVQASTVVADGKVTIEAGNNLSITGAEQRTTQSHAYQEKKSGLMGSGGVGFTVGRREQSVDQQNTTTRTSGSTIGSIQGDITLKAGGTYTQTGSDVIAPGGDVDIRGKNVLITEARESTTATSEQKFKQSGLTATISSPVLSAVQTVQEQTRAASNTSDPRMQALAAANSAMAANTAASALKAGSGVDFAGKSHQMVSEDAVGNQTGRDATAAERLGGVNLALTVGSSKSTSSSANETRTGRGSSVKAGGNVHIQATGADTSAGEESNLIVRGGTIQAGGLADLKADNKVRLLASENTSSQTSNNDSRSGALGVSMGTNGTGVTASASRGRGNSNGNDLSYTNTHVQGAKLNIQSGGDMDLSGAVTKGNSVRIDAGGKLTLESKQDTSSYSARQQSASGSMTVGAGAGGTLSANTSQTNSQYNSVSEQTGIYAGDGGFQIRANGIDMKGAVITSTQTAVAQDKNVLDYGKERGGQLKMSDIQNSASYDVTAKGISIGAGQVGKTQGITGLGAGVGSDKGQASSVTKSGISGIAGDKDVRTGDTQTGLSKIFDAEKAQKVQSEVQAQVVITQTFSREAPKLIASYADSKAAALIQERQSTTDPAKRQELQTQINQWAEGGSYRVALHTAAGALAGGVQGAAGAATSAASAGLMNNLQDGLSQQLQAKGLNLEAAKAAAQGVATLAAASLGAAVGSSQGAAAAMTTDANNRQLHPTEKQRIQTLANGDPQKQARLSAAACALVHCADGVPKDDPNYAVLKAMQDAGSTLTDEQALLKQQSGWDGRTYGPLFTYSGVDANLIDPLKQNKTGTRVAGAAQAVAGVAAAAGSASLCSTGIGCAAAAVGSTISADYAQAGIKQAVSGSGTLPYGERVLQSLGMSPEAAAYSYATLGIAPAAIGTAGGLVGIKVEAAGTRLGNVASETVAGKSGANGLPRVFVSNDPIVGKTATTIEQVLPGAVKDVNVPIKNPGIGLSSDADILLRNGDVIEVKSGGGTGATTQVANQTKIIGNSGEVIVYGPNLKASVIKGIESSGTKVFKSLDELLSYIKTKGL